MQSRLAAAGIPQQPRCSIGCPIMVITPCESRVTASFGHVVGFEFNPKDSLIGPSWWYSVEFTEGTDAGHRDWVTDEDLVLLDVPTAGGAV